METFTALKQFIVENYYVEDPSRLTGDVSLFEQGILDSTGVLELVSYLETTFGIRVGDDELLPENLDSIDRIVAFIQRKHSSQVHQAS